MSLLTILGLASMVFVCWFTWWTCTGPQGGAGQSRRESIIEAWTNIVIGFTLNFLVNLALIPLMTDGGRLSASANFWGGWIYTSISMLRQYTIRRWFNNHIHQFSAWLAQRLRECRFFFAAANQLFVAPTTFSAMIPSMQIEQRMALLTESLKEMVETARAIHGEGFAQTVAVLFELQSVMELHGMVLQQLPESDRAAYLNPMANLTASIGGWVQLLSGLDEDLFVEAVQLAERMADRQEDAHRDILQGAQG